MPAGIVPSQQKATSSSPRRFSETAEMSDPEERAAAALRRGDRDTTLEVLMDAYGTRIYGFCRWMVKRPEDAEDALQTTFLNAYEAMSRFEGRSSFCTWLFAIARNRCLDLLKKRSAADRSTVSEQEAPRDPVGNGEGDVQRHLLARVLDENLLKLSPKERAAVLLRFRDGFSYPEMASICNERAPALERRVARALTKLRRVVDPGGEKP